MKTFEKFVQYKENFKTTQMLGFYERFIKPQIVNLEQSALNNNHTQVLHYIDALSNALADFKEQTISIHNPDDMKV